MAQRSCFVLLPLLLAACATTSLPSARVPPIGAPTTEPRAVVANIAPAALSIQPGTPASADVWARLRSSFAMSGCDADPAVLTWARRYTHDPRRFEAQMKAALPRLAYIQPIAASHDVAGEFALLPWVESRYLSAPSVRSNRPAGIWQIMPVTASAMGLHVNREYDGRLDLAAATEAVMRMLHRYHERYGDWNLVDRAYNAGEFAMRQRADKPGMAASDSDVMHDHLAKLLAIACVVREPARFHVTLPALPAERQLVAVPVARSMPLAQAAAHAGMSTAALRDLNSAFRNGMLDTRYADHLLLPKAHVGQFHDAMQASRRGPPLHIVKTGENLRQIARDYSVRVAQLRLWNHLGNGSIQPGQTLQVGASR